MAKRRLSRRQAWRIEKVQQERRARAERGSARGEGWLRDEHLGPEQEGLVVARYGSSAAVEDRNGRLHRCFLRQNLGDLVCGDRVAWQEAASGNGVVVAIRPRRTVLTRGPSEAEARPVAANLDRIGIVIAPRPSTPDGLIDRYLVAAEVLGIAPFLVVNKSDLLDPEARSATTRRLAVYAAIGYEIHTASTRSSDGLDDLHDALRNHVSVLVGQSGVGKSSLINALRPGSDIPIGDLSEATGKGTHTTTAARLYHLPTGGSLIDSPGVREFALGHVDPAAVAPAFREFHPFLGHCRFRDCGHRKEPGCALRAAVDRGSISARRLDSYHRIIESLSGDPDRGPGTGLD